MPLFQKTVISKYLKTQDKNLVQEKWIQFQNHFLNPAIQENIRNSKEEQYQGEFLLDLFVAILGYTKNPQPDFNLTTEYKNVKDSKKADGAIIINEKVVAVIELKGTDTTDLNKIEVQAFGYKNNQPDCTYIITSNFEKIRLYIDNAIEHIEFNLFKLTKSEFDILYLLLACNNIAKNTAKSIKEESLSQEDQITKRLYKDYSLFKRELFHNLVANNTQFEPIDLFKKSQKLLDRFLFLFFAEDRHLLPPNSVRLVLSDWKDLQERDVDIPLYDRFKKYFEYLNTGYKGKRYDVYAYNGGLFKPDEILDHITIDDNLLYQHALKLSDYDFASEVDVNILGHIFENSLNELDEIKAELEGQAIDKSKTKRKKDGVFYTPKYITKYIVENTVGKLCNEKKNELQILDEDYIIDKKRQKKTVQHLNEKLQVYRNWLLQLTICDPACGSGAFLNQALDFLINEHAYIDELQAKLFGDAMVLSDVEKSILENNLFGVDLNEESVEIAKLSLWLRTAQPNRKLNDLSGNIKCGNSLIDDPEVAGDKAFYWQVAFPQVFAKGGFDVIIGNPPYFNIQTLGANSIDANYIQKKYSEIWQDKSDILFYFFVKALQISKNEVGFIVSNAFLFSDKAQKLRNYMLSTNRLTKIINFEKFMIFSDASITSCITFFSKKSIQTKAIILKDRQYSLTEISDKINNKQLEFEVSLSENKVFALDNKEISTLNKKIDSNHKKLFEMFHIGKGMETASNSVFSFDSFPHQFPQEFVKKRMVGENIERFTLTSSEAYILYFEDVENFDDLPLSIQNHLIENKIILEQRATVKNEGRAWWRYSRPMHKEFYNLNKIWCSYRGIENKFMIDETNSFIGLTNTTVIFDTNEDYALKYILALLNSKLLNFRYKSIGKQTGGGVFEYFANGVGKFPIASLEKSRQLPFIEKADLILLLNKNLQEKSTKFKKYLQSQFPIEKLNKKLENWYELDFGDFIKELNKAIKTTNKGRATNNLQPIKELTKLDEIDWMDVFETKKAETQNLKQQIVATDKEIDAMVYELYGLTEEEIKIVENS
jgi:hypothetical protein